MTNDELNARFHASGDAEKTMQQLRDELDDVKKQLLLANRDRQLLNEQLDQLESGQQADKKSAKPDGKTVAEKKAATAAPAEVVEDCYESQRFVPLMGWRPPFLPTDRPHWSDERGKAKKSKETVEAALDPKWRWTDAWAVDRTGATDPE